MQKFKRGDVVHITANLGQSMSHFVNDKDVVIEYSYAEKYGGGNIKSYSVMFLDTGNTCAWYEEHQLTFLYHGGEELIAKITKERKERISVESDLNWIVDNWKKMSGKVPTATMTKLMSLIGITEPWGKHGEGIDWYDNARYTFQCFDPVLQTGDIEKVKQFVAGFPKVNKFVFKP